MLLGIFERSGAIYTQPEDASTGILRQLALPVLQTYATNYSAEEYHSRVDGLDTIGLISSVCYPELDGQVDAYPHCYTRAGNEGGTRHTLLRSMTNSNGSPGCLYAGRNYNASLKRRSALRLSSQYASAQR